MISNVLTIVGDVTQPAAGAYSILGAAAYSNYVHNGPHDWTGQRVQLKVNSFPLANGLKLMMEQRGEIRYELIIFSDGTRNGQFYVSGLKVGSSWTVDPATEPWIAFGYDGPDVVAYSSVDGVTWTERARAPHVASTSSNFRVSAYNANGGTNRIEVSEVNPASATATTSAGPDILVASGELVTLTGTPAGGAWAQVSGEAVTLSAATSTTESTSVTFTPTNTSTVEPKHFVFSYTANAVADNAGVTVGAVLPDATRVPLPSGYHFYPAGGTKFTSAELFVGGLPVVSTDFEVTPKPTGTLWKGDFTQASLTDALKWNYLNGSYTSMGSLANSTSVPTATKKLFRSIIPVSAENQGYRAHNEIARVVPTAFPRSSVIMEYYFRIRAMGDIKVAEAKFGYALASAPADATHDQISYGGTKLPSSWSARTTLVPVNYVNGSNPWCMASYLYAHHAGGETYSMYGLRKMYINSAGQHFAPVEGTWYKHTVEVRENTPGVNDGVYKCSIDDVVYVNLTDVRWNETGKGPVSHLINQTYANTPLTIQFALDQSEPSLISVT